MSRLNIDDLIVGERVQQLADAYIGTQEDFCFNPIIRSQPNKHANINILQNMMEWNNPTIVFFYTHRIHDIAQIIGKLKNPVVLISHNSDQNIYDDEDTKKIINCKNVYGWISQNVTFIDRTHNKLIPIGIGLANSMWNHGDLRAFSYFFEKKSEIVKTKDVFFNFQIETNRIVRQPCFDALKEYYFFSPKITPTGNHIRLSEYKFCICPEGNGVDTHRLWEALYLKVVPIVLHTPFAEVLLEQKIPILVVSSWDKVPCALEKVKYEDYDFTMIEEKYTMDGIKKTLDMLVQRIPRL